MYTTVVIGGILLIVTLVGVAMWCCYRAGWDNGYDQQRGDQRQQLADDQHAKLKAGRHAKTQPRTTLAPLPLPQEQAPGAVTIPGRWYAEQMVKRMAAAHTVLPEPGKYQPEPARDSGAGTLTMAKVDIGATGPIAKLIADSEAWNAQQAVEDEIFRLGLAVD